MNTDIKGFTLIELLIVIGILSILSTVVVLVLNPPELLAQARDTQRISDLNSLKSAIAFYVATVASPNLQSSLGGFTCTANCSVYTGGNTAAGCGGRHGLKAAITGGGRGVTGGTSDWIPVAFSNIPGGAPLSNLPIDPTNNTTLFYSYACDNTAKTFQFDAVLESTKYSTLMGTDGGPSASFYEVGTAPGLTL